MSHSTLSPVAAAPRAARGLVAASLVAAAVASVVWVALEPPFPEGYVDRLAAIDEAGTSAAVSAFLFTASQLPWLVAVLGIAWVARRGAPRTSTVGAVLATLGAFGHAVFGGAMLVTVLMAGDAANREVYAGLLEEMEFSPLLMVFAAAGLLGTVLGLLLLGVALWRSRAVPRWLPLVLWAFLVVEFVGSNLSDYATYASSLCLLVAFGELARHVWEGPTDRTPTQATTPAVA
jgi:hypothetical protein